MHCLFGAFIIRVSIVNVTSYIILGYDYSKWKVVLGIFISVNKQMIHHKLQTTKKIHTSPQKYNNNIKFLYYSSTCKTCRDCFSILKNFFVLKVFDEESDKKNTIRVVHSSISSDKISFENPRKPPFRFINTSTFFFLFL